jgi:hypothetical protein
MDKLGIKRKEADGHTAVPSGKGAAVEAQQ